MPNSTIGPGQTEVCQRIKRICLWCKKDFFITPSMDKRGAGKFCSRKCQRSAPGKSKLLKCQTCGKEFSRAPSQLKHAKRYFCSKQCRYKAAEGKTPKGLGLRGSNCPAWKGGVTPPATAIRTSFVYKHWRKQCFARDNFTCQKCGIGEEGRLEIHHKKSFSALIQEAKNNTPLLSVFDAAMFYAPLWDMDNGITLCENCHGTKKLKGVIGMYGAGRDEICSRCIEKNKHDIDHRMADKIMRMNLPSEILDDEMRDLIKLRLGQRNGRTEEEKGA